MVLYTLTRIGRGKKLKKKEEFSNKKIKMK